MVYMVPMVYGPYMALVPSIKLMLIALNNIEAVFGISLLKIESRLNSK